MKFLHTADWHLGRLFHQVHLTDDQDFVLAKLFGIIEAHRPDAVVIAGDVYDRAVPPPEAVELWDRTLCRIAGEMELPVILIPGNHDSATRLGVGSELLRASGVHIVSKLTRADIPIMLRGADGVEVAFFGLPYAEPPQVRELLNDSSIGDHDSAMEAMCDRMRENFRPGQRNVLIAHAFVVGGSESESERPLSVGGAGTVRAEHFHGFDYVALGHLHSPQRVGENAVYSGSLLKYSFSECEDTKSVSLVDLSAQGEVTRREIPLLARRDVRRLEGELQELLARAATDPHRDDYLHVTLTDDGAILNAMAKLREGYPNVLNLERRFLERRDGESRSVARRGTSDADLFRNFVREVLNADTSEQELAVFAAAVPTADSEMPE
ncbi:nuclease SbcCD subunit D [Planctomycetia bacterium]|nr:nuclease SbcCD subunit D [Planctomycetia bacterium]